MSKTLFEISNKKIFGALYKFSIKRVRFSITQILCGELKKY